MTLRLLSLGCAAGLVLGWSAARPEAIAAQFGGTLSVGTGPMAWEQSDARDPLLHGALGASYRLPGFIGLRPELRGELGLSSEPTERTAMQWDLGVRLNTTGEVGGAWLGAATGAAGVGRNTTGLTRLEGGVHRTFGPAGVEMWLSRTRFGSGVTSGGGLGQDSGLIDTLGVGGGRGQSRVTEYTELGARTTVGLGRYDLGLTILRRIGATSLRRTGWEVTGTWWVAPGIGLVGATGRALPQFGLAVPGGRYGTVGLRLSVGNADRRRGEEAGKRVANERVPRLAVVERRLVLIWAAPARSAEVMGDFTDWKPVSLVLEGGGRWRLPVELEPGVHQLNVRFDGGAWVVPSGALAVNDGFGGQVGMVVVR